MDVRFATAELAPGAAGFSSDTSSTMVISGSRIQDCIGVGNCGGGFVEAECWLSLLNGALISRCSSPIADALAVWGGVVEMFDSKIKDCDAADVGGAFWVMDGRITLVDAAIEASASTSIRRLLAHLKGTRVALG